jgi:Flp pilus assembly protein TadD
MSAEASEVAKLTPDAVRKANQLYDAGKVDEAAQIIEEFMLREPNDAQALTMSATILKKCKRLPIAYSLAKRATELRPDRPEPWNAFGHCAQVLWRLDEAQSAYRKALQRAKSKQQQALYLNNLGSIHIDDGNFAKAEPFIRQSLQLDPNDRMARHNMGLCLLARRQWREAWPHYSASVGTESRLNVKYMPDPGEPAWDGTKGKTVAVYGEQGLGDEIVGSPARTAVHALIPTGEGLWHPLAERTGVGYRRPPDRLLDRVIRARALLSQRGCRLSCRAIPRAMSGPDRHVAIFVCWQGQAGHWYRMDGWYVAQRRPASEGRSTGLEADLRLHRRALGEPSV